MNLKRTGKAAVSAGISMVLALAPVSTSVAYAVTNSAIESTSAELQAARAHLNDLANQCETKFAELEDQQAELEATRQQISETEGQIEVKEQELIDARAVLSQNISENYKTGINFLSFLLGSDSFDDLVSRVYYADKVAAHQNEAISTVLTIQEELDEQKETLVSSQEKQEELVAKTRETASELQQVVAEQQTYVNGLDAQLQAEIAAQQEAERKAAEEQARKEAEERARQEEAQRQAEAAQQQQQSQTTQEQSYDDDDEETGYTGGSSYVPVTPAPTPTRRVTDLGSGVGAAIEYAKSQLGVSYSWGGNAIAYSEFDCSGLVWWSFQQAGISIPRGQRLSNGYGNSMIGWCLSNGGWTTSQANLQAGDLMFWGSSVESTGHVGLCIGGGQMIHSNWNGVEITSVYYNSGSFVGGGPIV